MNPSIDTRDPTFQAKVLSALRIVLSLPNFSAASNRNPFRILSSPDASGYQPLHYAAASGNVQLLCLLLEIFSAFPSQFGLLVTARDRVGNTPLHFAVERGFLDVVRILVTQAKVNVNLGNDRGCSCLHLAASVPALAQRLDLAHFLLSNGADPNLGDSTATTPLHMAAACGNEALVKLLLESGAFVDALDDEG